VGCGGGEGLTVWPKAVQVTRQAYSARYLEIPVVAGEGRRVSAPTSGASQSPVTKSSNSMRIITSTPPGADIEVDGVFLGNTPAEVPVSIGIHTVKLSKKGCVSYERKIQVLSSGAQRVSIELELAN